MFARCILPDVCLAAPPDLIAEAARVIDAAEAEGLPPGPLVAKAREGAAKGVSPERVVLAVQELAGRLRQASALLPAGSGDRTVVLTAGAVALRSGVSPGGLGRLGRVAEEHRADAILAAADLVSLGIAEDQSILLVERSAGSPNAAVAVRDLGAAAAAMLGQGATAEVVVDQLSGPSTIAASSHEPPAYGAGGSKGKDPAGKGLDDAPGQQKK